MLTLDEEKIKRLEAKFPGIGDAILAYESARLPACPGCGSDDTASVQVGVEGRTLSIASATTKFRLIPKRPKPGKYFCNICKQYFN